MQSHVIDVTDADKPEVVEGYHYLIGTEHIDDADGTEYRVTRIVNHDGYIVAYRTSLLLNGKLNKWEDDTYTCQRYCSYEFIIEQRYHSRDWRRSEDYCTEKCFRH